MKTGIYFIIAAIVVVVAGAILFRGVNNANVVDSISRGIYINGFRSFAWPNFIGLVLLMTGLITIIAPKHEKGHRYN